MQITRFADDNIINILSQRPEKIDTLPFGAILLDRKGDIIKYNKAEGKLSGLDVEHVIHKNFFTDIARCSKEQPIYEVFLKFQNGQQVDSVLSYEIKTRDTRRINVTLHMKSKHDQCWLFLRRT